MHALKKGDEVAMRVRLARHPGPVPETFDRCDDVCWMTGTALTELWSQRPFDYMRVWTRTKAVLFEIPRDRAENALQSIWRVYSGQWSSVNEVVCVQIFIMPGETMPFIPTHFAREPTEPSFLASDAFPVFPPDSDE